MLDGKRRAVIVGIDKYEYSKAKYKDSEEYIPSLEGAENDAKEMYERLSDPHIGNFEISKDDHCLLGDNATCGRIRRAISDVFWNTDTTCDLAIFYFSGHGYEDGYHDGYMAPYDMLKKEPLIYGINMRELKQIIARSKHKCTLVILDCCYSAIMTKGDKAMDSETKYDEHLQDFTKDVSAGGRIVLASSEAKSREVCLKHQNQQGLHHHGIFTYHLIEGMGGKAYPDKGIIYLEKLGNYVKEALGEKQKPKFYVSQVAGKDFGISNIQFTVVPQIYNDFIQSRISDAKSFFDKGHISSVIDAAKIVSEVLNTDVKNEDAKEIRNKIDEYLIGLKGPIDNWLDGYGMVDVQSYIPDIFGELQELPCYLCFNKIIELTNRENALQKVLLSHLYSMVIEKDEKRMANDEFINKCKSSKRALSQPVAPLSSQQKAVNI